MRYRTTIHAIVISVLTTLIGASQSQAALISESQEMQMGRDAARQVEARYKVSTDRNAVALVEQMGRKVASSSSRPKLPWQFKVLESKDVNALSVPGYVYINRGLIDFTSGDRDQLAAVIAHEVAHTTARHAVKQYEKQLGLSLGIQVLFKKQNARQLGGFAANLALLGYSRSDEFEADKLGVRYAHAAGYDPNGMVRFFRKLQQKEGKDSGGLTVYFRTHPPTKDRISRAEKEIKALGVRPQAVIPVDEAPANPSNGVRGQDLVLLVLGGLLAK